MPDEIRDLLELSLILERHSIEARHRMVQYLVGKYGLMPALSRDYERQRKTEQRSVPDFVPDNVPDNVPDSVSRTSANPSPLVVRSSVSKASKAVRKELDQEALLRAEGALKPEDFAFLNACPEPFRTQWLLDPDWWISLRDGYPKIAAQREASKFMSWASKFKPGQLVQMHLRERLRRWIGKADMWRQSAEERQAVRNSR